MSDPRAAGAASRAAGFVGFDLDGEGTDGRSGTRLVRPAFRVRSVPPEGLSLGSGTHYGMSIEGGELRWREVRWPLLPTATFVVPGEGEVHGLGLVITVDADVGVFQVGGPLEVRGRLRYIDGCTDTLLVCPTRLGGPCLNHLHIPAGTRQSPHTHPSDRVGVIARGTGRCVTEQGEYPLAAGMGWWIPAGVRHCFHTDGVALDVVAWHPDSDFGPTDEDHPMLNRTIVG